MKKNILSYPSQLNEVIKENIVFSIHSIFKNTVNLKYKDTVISLQHRDLMQTPMSICLDCNQYEFIEMFSENENTIYLRNGTLYINNSSFKSSECKIIDYKFDVTGSIKPYLNKYFYKHLKTFLDSKECNGELLNAYRRLNENSNKKQSILCEYFYKKIYELRNLSFEEFSHQCIKLIGAGEGLTPSGDDFLCGILASTYFINSNEMINFRKILSRNILSQLDKTTDISRAYLKHACEGRYMDGLIRLYNTVEIREDVDQILYEISALGHSSGTDLLVGLIFGLELGGMKE